MHLEPSIDALSWHKREERFERKFRVGRKYIFGDVLPWLNPTTPLTQRAILVNRGSRTHVGGGEITTIDETTKEIRDTVSAEGKLAKCAISEQFPLLRTIQLIESGYYRRL
jgi:hypothetical protein